jgi:hypothetical protein
VQAARAAIDPAIPGFSDQFPSRERIDEIIRRCYVETHRSYIEQRLSNPT